MGGEATIDSGLLIPVDQAAACSAITILVDDLDCSITVPLNADDLDKPIW